MFRIKGRKPETEGDGNHVPIAKRINDAFVAGPPVDIPFHILNLWSAKFSDVIGRGGFGTVYKGTIVYSGMGAIDAAFEGLGKTVAIKRVNCDVITAKSTIGSPSGGSAVRAEKDITLTTIMREINVLTSFRSCPNIIRLVGYCVAGASSADQLCLAYEFAHLGDLMGFLIKRPSELLWQHRLRIAVGIATGLNVLHNNNPGYPAYHRDLKSSNVVLMDNFTPKIIDCGLSRFVPEGLSEAEKENPMLKSTIGARFGTPEYMCPEYSRNRSLTFDAKCDVYSRPRTARVSVGSTAGQG